MHRGKKNCCFIAALVFVASMFAGSLAHAAIFDPSAGWKTITTPHFRIHHPEKISDVAQKAAHIFEDIHPEITEKWNWKPWGKSEVVLTDSTDEANGMTSVLPYNWMIIYVAPPDPDSSLAHYDDWMRTLLIHEYTHLVQIDAVGGFMHFPRVFLGKLVSPSGLNPTWMREGISEYDETIMTSGGRGRGSYSEMIVRTAVLDDAFPPIDVADGLGWTWPGYKTAYVYGIKFIQWLTEKYGEDKLLKLDHRIRSSILIGMLNHQARNVYHKTFYQLWREWKSDLQKEYAAEKASIESHGETKTSEIIVPTGRDGQYEAPTLSPDKTKLVYTATSPHGKAEIRLLNFATGKTEVLKKGHSASQFSWSPDGTKIVYSVIASYKHYYRYHDLWLYDFSVEKKRLKKLTTGARARDPEFDKNGKSIIFVAGNKGQDELKRIDIESKEISLFSPSMQKFAQFANPRFSPDGRFIAISVWKPGDGWRIYRFNSDGSNAKRLTSGKGLVIEARPVWSIDGKFVIYSSDEDGITNLYSALANGGGARRLTNVTTGIFQPQLGNGNDVIAQYYTSKGFVIARFEIDEARSKRQEVRKTRDEGRKKNSGVSLRATDGSEAIPCKKQSGGDCFVAGVYPELTHVSQKTHRNDTSGHFSQDPKSPEISNTFKDEKYVAFGKSLFLPRFIVPYAMYGDGYVLASALTGGTDPLHWHTWTAMATYRSDANFFGYNGLYIYNRFKPIFGAMVSRFAVDFGNLTFVNAADPTNPAFWNTVHFYEKRQRYSAFMAIPLSRHVFSLSYFFEDHMPKTTLTPQEQAALNLGHFAGFLAEYRYGDSEKYPASISRENGRNIKLTTSVTDKHLGSGDRNEQIIFAGDWREYVKLWHHHVLALRSCGGMTWGDKLVQGTFAVGGSLGEGQFGGGGSFNYFPLRGLPISAMSSTRAMVFSAEYRFPIYSLQRGLGTIPLYFKEISGAVFADYGDGWFAGTQSKNSIKTFFDDFFLGVGAELRGDFVIGHGLPIHGRFGYAIIVRNRDRLGSLKDPILGSNIKYGIMVLTIGTIF